LNAVWHQVEVVGPQHSCVSKLNIVQSIEEYTKYYKTNREGLQDIVKTVGLMLKFEVVKYYGYKTIVTKFLVNMVTLTL
jgi:hypothetical protein